MVSDYCINPTTCSSTTPTSSTSADVCYSCGNEAFNCKCFFISFNGTNRWKEKFKFPLVEKKRRRGQRNTKNYFGKGV